VSLSSCFVKFYGDQLLLLCAIWGLRLLIPWCETRKIANFEQIWSDNAMGMVLGGNEVADCNGVLHSFLPPSAQQVIVGEGNAR